MSLTDEGVGSPGAGRAGAVDKTNLGDLEEAERAGCVRGTVAANLCKVVDDGTVVALGPGVPLQLHSVASVDRNGDRCGLRRLVTGDVTRAELARLHET